MPWTAPAYTTNQTASAVLGQTGFTQAILNSGGPNANSLNSPVGISCDGTRVFIADRSNNRVLIFNSIPTGSYASADVILGQTSGSGTSCNQGGSPAANCLCFPSGVSSAGGKLFIADSANNRVLIFNSIPVSNNASANVVIGQTDMTGNQPNPVPFGYTPDASSLRGPTGVVSDGTRLFVADTDNRRVLIYNTIPAANHAAANVVVGQSSMTAALCSSPQSASTLCNPVGLAVSGSRLFISDTAAHRLLIFNTLPAVSGASADLVLGQASMSATSANQAGVPAANTLSAPWAVSTDGVRLFVADTGNHRLLIYNQIPVASNTAADAVLGQAFFTGSGANQGGSAGAATLYSPSGAAVSGIKLLVADRGNHRALMYDDPPTPTPTFTATRTITLTHTFSPTRTSTISPTFTRTFTATVSPSSTRTDSPTGTPTRTSTVTLTASPTPSSTRTTTETRSPTATASPSQSVSPSLTGSPTPTFSASPSLSPTASSTGTPSSTSTATSSHTPTATASPTATPSWTLTMTATASPTDSPTTTYSNSPTLSPTAPGTFTFSPTQSPSGTTTPTPTWTGTASPSPSSTASSTRTDSPTESPTAPGTFTFSPTPSPSLSPTGTATVTFTFTASTTASPTALPVSSPTGSTTPTATPSATLTVSPTPSPTVPALTATPSPTQEAVAAPDSAKTGPGQFFVYPSPARGDSAAVAYHLERPATVQIRIYNRFGDLAADLEESKAAGPQESRLDLSRFSPGIYYTLCTIHDAVGKSVLGPGKFVILH